MGDDAKKLGEKHLSDSSKVLTDWLLKYKIDNISYLSVPPVQTQIIKIPRKGPGGLIPFDSRDVIRPTVQLYKHIRAKSDKANDSSPSPQRKPRVCPAASPIKECNKVFTHKGSHEETLEMYRKLYTYARVKHDKVNKEKIESAVALFRQRELEKESGPTAKHLSEKFQHKKMDQSNANKQTTKSLKVLKKSSSREKINKTRKNVKIEAPKKQKVKEIKTKLELIAKDKSNSKKGTAQNNKQIEKSKNESNLSKLDTNILDNLQKIVPDSFTIEAVAPNSEVGKDDCVFLSEIMGELDRGSNKTMIGDHLMLRKNYDNEERHTVLKRSRKNDEIKKVNEKLPNKTTKPNEKLQKQDQLEAQKPFLEIKQKVNREILKKRVEKIESNNLPNEILSRTNVKVPNDHYIIIKPAAQKEEDDINKGNEEDSSKEDEKTKSIDDLLKEYRLKYRNMTKLR